MKITVEKAGCEETALLWHSKWSMVDEQLSYLRSLSDGEHVVVPRPKNRKETALESWKKLANDVNELYRHSSSSLDLVSDTPHNNSCSSVSTSQPAFRKSTKAHVDRLLMMSQMTDSEIEEYISANDEGDDDTYQHPQDPSLLSSILLADAIGHERTAGSGEASTAGQAVEKELEVEHGGLPTTTRARRRSLDSYAVGTGIRDLGKPSSQLVMADRRVTVFFSQVALTDRTAIE